MTQDQTHAYFHLSVQFLTKGSIRQGDEDHGLARTARALMICFSSATPARRNPAHRRSDVSFREVD